VQRFARKRRGVQTPDARVVIVTAAGLQRGSPMKPMFLTFVLSLSLGCSSAPPPSLGTATNWKGESGLAVTLALDESFAKKLQSVCYVQLDYSEPEVKGGTFWQVDDLVVPVLKVGTRSVTLFFPKDSPDVVHLLSSEATGAAFAR
jgi:hypothetical protein